MNAQVSEFELFKETEGYRECRQLGRELAAANLGGVMMAIGAISNEQVSWVARKALEGDSIAIGEFFKAQLDHYIETKAQAFVSEAWRSWQ